jgi:uncharacterized protein YodC (DUF2158 family)
MDTFKDGDLVRLASGGPEMVVQIDRTDGYVTCWWFDGVALKCEAFLPVALCHAKPPTPAAQGHARAMANAGY